MIWWMWVVLWVAVVALGVIFLAVVGFRVFRRGARTLREFGEAMDRFEVTTAGNDGDVASHPGVPGIPVPAVFADPEEVRAARGAAKLRRIGDRRSTRVLRRADRGQPQLIHDMPHL